MGPHYSEKTHNNSNLRHLYLVTPVSCTSPSAAIGRVMNFPYEDRLCTKCSSADIGDEFVMFLVVLFLLNPEKISFNILL